MWLGPIEQDQERCGQLRLQPELQSPLQGPLQVEL